MTTAAFAADAKPTFRQTAYENVPGAWTLSNGTVRLVIAPGLGGRILFYGFVDGPNVLWEPPSVAEQAQRLGGWQNHGGDKTWIWPQNGWAARTGHAWPPPKEFDQTAYALTQYDDGSIELLSPPLPGFANGRLARRIRMAPAGSGVTIEQAVLPSPTPTGRPADPSPMAAWQVTQTPRPDLCVMGASDGTVKVIPTSTRPADEWPADVVRTQGAAFAVFRVPAAAGRRKVTADATVLANLTADRLFIQRWQSDDPKAAVRPDAERCQLYLDNTPTRLSDQYLEMEWVGPPSEPGKASRGFRTTWNLHRMPTMSPTPAAVIDAVQQQLHEPMP